MPEQFDLIIKDGTIITMDSGRRVIDDGIIAIKGDSISVIADSKNFDAIYGERSASRVIDASGKFVFPGFITTHTHLFQTLLKGLGRDKPLFEWLDSSVRRALRNYDEECMFLAAMNGLIEALRTGTTTVTDYQYCHTRKGFDEVVIRAYKQLGIRGVMCKTHTDVSILPPDCALDYQESEDDYFAELEGLCVKYRDDPLVSMSLAPGIIWDLSKEGFRRTREMADKYAIPITMHFLETEEDDRYSLESLGMRAIDYLDECGILGPDFVGVHCVQANDDVIRKFKSYDVKVSHCPVSNMILASGVAPVPGFLRAGITVSLACDGAASNDSQDMLEVMKSTALLHKVATRDASLVSAAEVLTMATEGGAKALGKQKEIGSLETGKKADLFIYNPLTARSTPVNDPIPMIVYSGSSAGVETTVVGGRVVLDRGVIVNADEEDILRKTQRVAEGLVRRSGL
jgi:5-methylthioadenosine/S-adenosylhomocysteine deaminase